MIVKFKRAVLYTARSTPKGHVPVVELWHGCTMEWRKSIGPAMIATQGSALPGWLDGHDQRTRNYHLALGVAAAWARQYEADHPDVLASARTSLNGKRMRRRGHVTEWVPSLKAGSA